MNFICECAKADPSSLKYLIYQEPSKPTYKDLDLHIELTGLESYVLPDPQTLEQMNRSARKILLRDTFTVKQWDSDVA